MSPNPGAAVPAAAALFTYSNAQGVVVSQAGVEASEPIASGRVFVDESGTRTGLALVNPSAGGAAITMILRDAAGAEFARSPLALPAGQHIARFVDELFPSVPQGFTGSLTFVSDAPLAAVTLRQSLNVRNEPLYSTLPVVNLSAASSADPIVFPQIAVGAGYTTQLVLINRGDQLIRGRIRLTASNGQPLVVRYNSSNVSDFAYQIAASGTLRADLDTTAGLNVGYAVVTPDVGSTTPAGTAIFLYKDAGRLITEAGVAATVATTSARIFVDQIGSRTGVALANPGNQTAELSLTLLDRQGNLESTTARTLPPGNHLAIFADEVFPTLGQGSSGLMEIRSTVPIIPITLKLTLNTRGDLIVTTLPVSDLTRATRPALVVFPQIAIGGGFSTRLICLNAEPANAAAGTFSFFRSDGSAMTIPFSGETNSRFNYKFAGGRQFYPGNSATVSSVSLVDPVSNQIAAEMVVNEGSSVPPRFRIYDNTGNIRDDFDVTMTSLSTNVASVDNLAGLVYGLTPGFSTLNMLAGTVISNATVTVVGVTAGTSGFGTGVASDQAQRLYISSGGDHTVRLAASVSQTAEIYAGISNSAGLRNDERLASLFRVPAAIAIDNNSRSIYIADSANHVIRRVPQGTTGQVETLAGTGSPGSLDGAALLASFNSPQGIALDGKGNLWVADTGNHVIRKINLISRTVSTLAGTAASPGFVDGAAGAARFSSPAGIALEPEPVVQALERERLGLPAPPVRMVVSDSGNGAIRRVIETGAVETLRGAQSALIGTNCVSDPLRFALSPSRGGDYDPYSPPREGESGPRSASPIGRSLKQSPQGVSHTPSLCLAASDLPFLRFNAPAGIAVDPAGNIYVAEPGTRQVRAILQNGNVVPVVAPNSVQQPRGLAISSGRLVVVDTAQPVREIRFGAPSITSIEPARISNKGGDRVTIRGKNFDPSSVVVLGRVKVETATSVDSETIVFQAPASPSGTVTLTIQTRAGVTQKAVLVDAVPLSALPPGQITTIAGGTTSRGDGSLAVSAQLAFPSAMAFDGDYVFIADTANNQIRRFDTTTGIINTVAGSGRRGFSGDNGRALLATMDSPRGVAIDSSHNVFVSDTGNNRVRKIDTRTGNITTIAGNGDFGYSGDGGPATAAGVNVPGAIAFDAADNLLIADVGNSRVRRVAASTKVITTIAGNGQGGMPRDGVVATSTSIDAPLGLALDTSGNIFISEYFFARVRRIEARTGIITTIAGNGGEFDETDGVAVDGLGNVFVADRLNSYVRRIDAATGNIAIVAGTGAFGFSGDQGPANKAALNGPTGLAMDASGNLFIADTDNSRIRRVAAIGGAITTVAGNGSVRFSGDGGPATGATLFLPAGIALDGSGNLYISDSENQRIRKVEAASGIITTFAGNGDRDFSGDRGPATAATLNYPSGLAVDGSGNVLIADSFNNRIRRVDVRTGIITTIAGKGGAPAFSGDNGPATAASLAFPTGITVDAAGNIYIADSGNDRIRRVSASGIITTYFGNGTDLSNPTGVALDRDGNLYVADFGNSAVHKIDPNGRLLSSIGLNGLYAPTAVAVDAAGNLFIADYDNSWVFRIEKQTGGIGVVAGNGNDGFTGDNVFGTATSLNGPGDITLDAAGNLYIADSYNNRVRAVRSPK